MSVVPAAVEESRAARQQRQQSRLRDRGGIFVPPENNAILDFLLARTVTGESPSKAATRQESLRLRAESSPVREDGKGKGPAVESADEEGADAAIHISNPTRRKSGRVAGPGRGQPVAGPSRDVAGEDGARSKQARARGKDNAEQPPSAPKPKLRSRATKGKAKVKEAPNQVSKSDEDDGEPAQEATQSQPKLKSKPKPRARAAKAKKLPPARELPPADETANNEPSVEKPKPRSTKAKGKKPSEPATADDPEPEPALEAVKRNAQPTKSMKTPKADVADGLEPADEVEVTKPVAKKRGRPPKNKASTADGIASTPDQVAVAPSEVASPKIATVRSPTKRVRDADSDDEDLSNYLPTARKRAKIAATSEAKAKPTPKRAKAKATVVHPDSPKPAPTRKAPARKKQPQPGTLLDPYDSDGSAVVIAAKKKPGNVRTASPCRRDTPPEPARKVPDRPKVVTKKPPPPKQREEVALSHESDGDTTLGAKVSKSQVAQKTAKSNRARDKVAPDELEDEGDGKAGGAKASKLKPSKPVKKSVRAPPSAELVEEAHVEDLATTSKKKVPVIVTKANRSRMKVAFVESEEASDEMASAQQQSTSQPQLKPRKRASKPSICESEEQEEPQQAPPRASAKNGSTKSNAKRAREKDEGIITVNEPGPKRKKAKTPAIADFQSDEETLVAQAPPKSSKPDRLIDLTRSLKVKTQSGKDPQKPAAKLDTHKTKRLPPEIKERIHSKPSARLPPPESDDDPIDFLS